MHLLKKFLFILIVLNIISCSSSSILSKSKKSQNSLSEPLSSAEDLYTQGLDELHLANYKKAADLFEQIYFEHPGHLITPHAEIMQAYSLYKNHAYEDASDIIDEFINLHPLHADIAYAHYLRFLTTYMNIVDVTRDQSASKQAKLIAINFINRFPHSLYTADIKHKLQLIDTNLAGYEMEIGRFYLAKDSVLAAIGHFDTIINEYQATSYNAEALARLVESYEMLGLKAEATKYAAVLHHNYPNSSWSLYTSKLISHHHVD